MRIISGEFGGRRFIPPVKNWPTRPTTDIAKEGLFNILHNRMDFEETIMLDLFGGTGNHCYEFISRGCESVTYVDNHAPAIDFVKKISTDLNISDRINICKMDVFKFIKSTVNTYSYIFADPPYSLPTLITIPDKIFETNILIENGIFVLEHSSNNSFKAHPRYVEERNYGATIFSFFKHSK